MTRVYSGENIGPNLFPARHRRAVEIRILTMREDARLARQRGDMGHAAELDWHISFMRACQASSAGDQRPLRRLFPATVRP